MSITSEEVKKVAHLARLKLTAEEEQKYAEQLSAVLDYVDQLKEVADSGTLVEEPTHSISELRTDQADGGRYQGEILEQAPKLKDNYLAVPAVFTEEK